MGLELYLAHPFDSRKTVRRWELKFEKSTGISLINPFFDSPSQGEKIHKDDFSNERYYKTLNNKIIVNHDIKLISRPETYGILAIVNGNTSYGTIQEMVYAKNAGKEVFSVVSNGHQNHPWLKYHSDKIFRCLGDFQKWIAPDCNYCDGTMKLAGRNKKMGFDMYFCDWCDKSWMTIDKDKEDGGEK